MKRMFFAILLLTLAIVSVACDASSSTQPTEPPPPPAPQITPGAGGPTLPPGACQARLWGKIVNAAGQARPNTQVDIASGNYKAKTTADANGLYGFAGLCAGDYAISVTPQGGQPQPWPNKVALDGAKQVKVDLQVK